MAANGRAPRAAIVILSSFVLVASGACRSEESVRAATPWALIEPDATSAARVEAADTSPSAAPIEAVAPSRPAASVELELVQGRAADIEPIAYEVLEPADAGPETPLVIALHGMGDTPRGFTRFVAQLGLRARVFIGRGPEPYLYGGRQWYDNEAEDAIKQVRQRAKDLTQLASHVERLHPGAGKPALVGFSQGAAVVLQAALEFPDRWRAVAGLSGFIASEAGATRPTASYPVLVTAGTEDEIVPAVRSWSAAGALVRYGHQDVRKLEFEGPHKVPKEVVAAVKKLFENVFATQ